MPAPEQNQTASDSTSLLSKGEPEACSAACYGSALSVLQLLQQCLYVFSSVLQAMLIPVLATGTAIQALQRLAASNPKLYKALLGMKKDSHGCISTATLMQVSDSRATSLCSLASYHAYTLHLCPHSILFQACCHSCNSLISTESMRQKAIVEPYD